MLKHHRMGAGLLEKQALWSPAYAAVDSIIGMNANGRALQVPFGDSNHEDSATAPTLVTTIGAAQVDFTYTNSGRHLWATQLGYEGPGRIPVLYFDGSTDWMESPDAAFWNDSAGTSEPSYNWAAWVFTVAGTSIHTLWAKTAANFTSGSDWVAFFHSDEKLYYRIIDDSAAGLIGSQTSVLSDGWHHLVGTKHDDSALSSSVITYVDGEADRADSGAGSYVVQEDGTTVIRFGALTGDGDPNGLATAGGPLGPIFEPVGAGAVWTPNQVRQLFQTGAEQLGV